MQNSIFLSQNDLVPESDFVRNISALGTAVVLSGEIDEHLFGVPVEQWGKVSVEVKVHPHILFALVIHGARPSGKLDNIFPKNCYC